MKLNKSIFIVGLLAMSLSPLYSANAIEYGGFGGRPAFPDASNPRTESIFIFNLEPGNGKDDGVLVVNNTKEKKEMYIYATDSTPSTGGAFACKQMSEPKNDVGAWIAFQQNEVTLEPGTNKIIPFTVKIPNDVSVGEHNGCVLIQEKKEKVEGQAGASISVRTGLRTVVTIPGEIVRNLEIVGFDIEKQKNGNFFLKPKVKNLGNVSIDASVKVDTSYILGKEMLTFGGQYPILRGESSDWNFELKKPFWGGWYRAEFTLEYDKNSEAKVGVNSSKGLTTLSYPSVIFWSAPTMPALAIEILVFIFILVNIFLLVAYIRQKRWIKDTWIEYQIVKEDKIQELAQRFNVSWKLLAKVNKIKAPYALNQGEKIKIPNSKK